MLVKNQAVYLFFGRLSENLRSCEQEQETKLSSWLETYKPLSDWLDQADHVLSPDCVDGSNMEDTRRQKSEIEVV